MYVLFFTVKVYRYFGKMFGQEKEIERKLDAVHCSVFLCHQSEKQHMKLLFLSFCSFCDVL